MSTAFIITGKQLPAHSVSIEIYSGIARFPCEAATARFLFLGGSTLGGIPPKWYL